MEAQEITAKIYSLMAHTTDHYLADCLDMVPLEHQQAIYQMTLHSRLMGASTHTIRAQVAQDVAAHVAGCPQHAFYSQPFL